MLPSLLWCLEIDGSLSELNWKKNIQSLSKDCRTLFLKSKCTTRGSHLAIVGGVVDRLLVLWMSVFCFLLFCFLTEFLIFKIKISTQLTQEKKLNKAMKGKKYKPRRKVMASKFERLFGFLGNLCKINK